MENNWITETAKLLKEIEEQLNTVEQLNLSAEENLGVTEQQIKIWIKNMIHMVIKTMLMIMSKRNVVRNVL